MLEPRLGFDSYTSEGDFYRDDSPEQQRVDEQRDFAFGGGLLKGITELPLDIMEFLSPEDEYNPGALAPDQSSPRQRIRTERLHGEQFYDELKQDPITKQAAEVGYGASMVVDPVLDTGLLMAPHLLKGLNAIRKGEKPAIKLADLMTDEVGAVGDLSKGVEVFQGRSRKGLEDFFNPEGVSWGSTDKSTAEIFAAPNEVFYPNRPKDLSRGPVYEKEIRGEIYPLTYDLKNPMKVDIKDTLWNADVERELIADAKSKGHDGLEIRHSDNKTDYVAFDKSQVTLGHKGKPTASGAGDDLPTSVEQRTKRAEEQGFTTEAYTGSTHDIKEFEGSLSNPENDWGRGTYASTSVDDVNANYAGEGPDLTQRLENRAIEIKQGIEDEWTEADWAKGEVSGREATQQGLAQARKELIGPAEGGVVYPLKINTKNYAVIGGHNPTRITAPDFDELAKQDIQRADYDDLDDYEMAVDERRFELMDESEESLHAQVNDAMRDTDLWEEEGVMQEIMGELDEEIMDGDLRIDSIDEAVRKHVVDAYDDSGEMLSSGEISSQIIKNLGFDGVVDMKVNQKFGAGRQFGQKMEGVDADTAHVVTFPGKEATIRSRHAMFDPKKIKSKDILASAIGVGAIAGAEN